MSDTPEERHARIMVECGCTVEDVALTFGWSLLDALYTVMPNLTHRPDELKRARKLLKNIRAHTRDTHVIHSPERGRNTVAMQYNGRVAETRIAA